MSIRRRLGERPAGVVLGPRNEEKRRQATQSFERWQRVRATGPNLRDGQTASRNAGTSSNGAHGPVLAGAFQAFGRLDRA